MVSKRLSLLGWPNGHAKDSEETVAFCKLSGVKAHIQRYPLAQAAEAYKAMMTGRVRFRAVLVP
jgi:D-arabinose 1-dehydrogenase-like Zn-dependent alcohol dehydrogenase